MNLPLTSPGTRLDDTNREQTTHPNQTGRASRI
jgi:hypothetical protein